MAKNCLALPPAVLIKPNFQAYYDILIVFLWSKNVTMRAKRSGLGNRKSRLGERILDSADKGKSVLDHG